MLRLCWVLAVAAGLAQAQDFTALEKRVTDFTLGNGLRFILLERHEAPVVSFNTYVNAGTVDDPAGQTGLARLLERMAFKGSGTVGTRNWPEEKRAIEAADEAYARMEAERNKGPRMKQEQYETLRTQWRLAVDAADRLGQPDDYGNILQENGASGMKSQASWTGMQVAYTLPSNRLELWFAMESQRLMHPVLREFDKERRNAIEEDGKNHAIVQNRLMDALLSTAFTAHPYGRPQSGWPSDIAELRRPDARAFLDRYFVPGNITIAMAGDVQPEEVKRFAEKYFGGMAAKPLPEPVRTAEPEQQGPRTTVLEAPVRPLAAIAYKRPSYFDRDDTVLDVVQMLLVSGKSGMAYRELVQEKRLAAELMAGATFPDGRYPNLFVFLLAPAAGHRIDEAQKALDGVLFRLKTQKVGPDALSQAKAEVRAQSYQRLETNASAAEMLSLYTAAYGDWKKLFSSIEDVRKVTEEDVARVAQRVFIAAHQSTVYTSVPGAAARETTAGGRQ